MYEPDYDIVLALAQAKLREMEARLTQRESALSLQGLQTPSPGAPSRLPAAAAPAAAEPDAAARHPSEQETLEPASDPVTAAAAGDPLLQGPGTLAPDEPWGSAPAAAPSASDAPEPLLPAFKTLAAGAPSGPAAADLGAVSDAADLPAAEAFAAAGPRSEVGAVSGGGGFAVSSNLTTEPISSPPPLDAEQLQPEGRQASSNGAAYGANAAREGGEEEAAPSAHVVNALSGGKGVPLAVPGVGNDSESAAASGYGRAGVYPRGDLVAVASNGGVPSANGGNTASVRGDGSRDKQAARDRNGFFVFRFPGARAEE